MLMAPFPLYCGGRLLLGLYNINKWYVVDTLTGGYVRDQSGTGCKQEDAKTDEEIFADNIAYKLGHHRPPGAPIPLGFGPETHYICSDVLLNQKLLCEACKHVASPAWHMLGTIVAVTNANETYAEAFLSASGFKQAAKTNKFRAVEEREYVKQCITWIGDFHRDIKPILNPIAREYYGFEIT